MDSLNEDCPDYLGSRYHSELLARRIRAYYRKRGYEIPVRVEKENNVYVIRIDATFQIPSAE